MEYEAGILLSINQAFSNQEKSLHIILKNYLSDEYYGGVVLTNLNVFVCSLWVDKDKYQIDKYLWKNIVNISFIEGDKMATLFLEINDGRMIPIYNLSKIKASEGVKIAQTKMSNQQEIINIKAEELFFNYCGRISISNALKKLWNPDYIPPSRFSLRLSKPEEWLMSMTNQFVKDIHTFDRKMQGRILEAISEILSQPTTIKGDTIKPLTSDKKGLWRYRIGDYRLIYHPDIQSRQITLMNFASRGDIYD